MAWSVTAVTPWTQRHSAIALRLVIVLITSALSLSLPLPRACTGSSNDELVKNLEANGLVKDPRIAAAMKRVDRVHYLTRADKEAAGEGGRRTSAVFAYEDSPQVIGFGATISAPHMHAMCCELMMPAIEQGLASGGTDPIRILDVGSGSGYLVAVLARLVGNGGRVYGIEHIQQLVDTSINNLKADSPSLLATVEIRKGDGRLGWPDAAPFDAIHVGAAAPTVPPALISQLKVGGRLIIPVGPEGGTQTLELIVKVSADGAVKRQTVTPVMYVPLTSEAHQLRH